MPLRHRLFVTGTVFALKSPFSRRYWGLLCISTCYWRPVVHWKAHSTGHCRPQGKSRARDLPGHLYLRKFCPGVLATQPRADHFKPPSHVDCGITTGPPRVPYWIKWGGWKSVGDSTQALCNYVACGVSQLMCQSLHQKSHHIHKCAVLLFTVSSIDCCLLLVYRLYECCELKMW